MKWKLGYAHVTSVIAIVVALAFTPAAAHVRGGVAHIYQDHIEPKLSRDGTVNDPSNPVDWTRLKNVPVQIADGTDDRDQLEGTAAGGDLTGTYPNPQLAPNSVGPEEVEAGSLGLEVLSRGVATFTSDIGPIAAGDCTDLATGPVTANTGHDLLAFIDADLDKRLVMSPTLVSADRALFRLCNIGEVTIDPPSSTYSLAPFLP